MIEIVRAKAPRAKQPFHVRVLAEGNVEPLLAGETLTTLEDAHTALEALGRIFSPVGHATYAGGPEGGTLTIWLEEDDPDEPTGEHLHIPVQLVDEREAVTDVAKPRGAAKKAASSAAAGGSDG